MAIPEHLTGEEAVVISIRASMSRGFIVFMGLYRKSIRGDGTDCVAWYIKTEDPRL